MIHVIALLSSGVTGALFALAARVLGIEHTGVLVAIGIIGAGLQAILLIAWYLLHTRERKDAPPLLQPVDSSD